MIRILVEDVTIDRSDVINLHAGSRADRPPASPPRFPSPTAKARQTNADTYALFDRLLDSHTDAEVADALNRAAREPVSPSPPRIVLELRRNHTLPSRRDRLRAAGKLTIPETAEALGVHQSTIKAWHRAGLLTNHKADDRNARLFDPPTPGEPRPVKRQGSQLSRRVPTQPAPGGAV